MLTITFRTDNAAFDPDPAAEAARVLRAVADKLERGEGMGRCTDINGNTIGAWSLVDHRTPD